MAMFFEDFWPAKKNLRLSGVIPGDAYDYNSNVCVHQPATVYYMSTNCAWAFQSLWLTLTLDTLLGTPC